MTAKSIHFATHCNLLRTRRRKSNLFHLFSTPSQDNIPYAVYTWNMHAGVSGNQSKTTRIGKSVQLHRDSIRQSRVLKNTKPTNLFNNMSSYPLNIVGSTCHTAFHFLVKTFSWREMTLNACAIFRLSLNFTDLKKNDTVKCLTLCTVRFAWPQNQDKKDIAVKSFQVQERDGLFSYARRKNPFHNCSLLG